jgi:hypothetical protein
LSGTKAQTTTAGIDVEDFEHFEAPHSGDVLGVFHLTVVGEQRRHIIERKKLLSEKMVVEGSEDSSVSSRSTI